MTDRPILASDKERDSVVDVLRDAYTDARTWDHLRELTGDLPVEPEFGADLPQRNFSPGEVAPTGEPRQYRRERPLGRLLPIVFAWIMISAVAGSPDTAAALSVVFICLLACRVGYGGR